MPDVYNDVPQNIGQFEDPTDIKFTPNLVDALILSDSLATFNVPFIGNGIGLTNLFFKQNTPISHTGTTAETVVYTYSILNVFQANDFFQFRIMTGNNTNNANVKTMRVYVNSTPDLAGTPVLIATRILTSVVASPCIRTLVFKNNIAQQQILNPASNVVTDDAVTSGTISDLTIDFSTQKYFVITFQLATGTDTVGIRFINTKIDR